jgi:hypothetical protein
MTHLTKAFVGPTWKSLRRGHKTSKSRTYSALIVAVACQRSGQLRSEACWTLRIRCVTVWKDYVESDVARHDRHGLAERRRAQALVEWDRLTEKVW